MDNSPFYHLKNLHFLKLACRLALLCTVQSVGVEFRLIILQCSGFRRLCNVEDHPIWV